MPRSPTVKGPLPEGDLPVPLKIAVTPSSVLGLSGDFSQLLSPGSGPRASGVRGCDQRDAYLLPV